MKWESAIIKPLFLYVWNFKLTNYGRILIFVGLFSSMFVSGSLDILTFDLFAILFFTGFFAMMLNYVWRTKFDITVKMPDRVVAGATLHGIAKVRNAGWLPAYDVGAAFFYLPAGLHHKNRDTYIESLPAGDSTEIPFLLEAMRRGSYPLPPYRAYTAFPFRLLRSGTSRKPVGNLLVLPAFTPAESIDVPVSLRYQPGGVALTSNIGESPEYIGNREFRPGDSIRRLDMRAWGRIGQPVVREYQEEYYLRIALVLDTYTRGSLRRRQDQDRLEAAISLTATIVDALSRGEYLLDIFAAGPELYNLRTGRGASHFDTVLEILACIESCKTNPFDIITPALADELGKISTVIFVFLDWDDTRREMVRTAVECGCSGRVFIVNEGKTTLPPEPYESVETTVLRPEAIFWREHYHVMNVPRLIILFMLLVEITVTGILSETRAFPAIMFVVVIFLYLRPFRMQFTQRQKMYLFLAVTAFFATKMRMFPLEIQGRFSPFPGYYDLNHALAQLFIVLQLFLLGMHTFSRKEEKHLFSVHYLVPLMGIVCIALIGDFISHKFFYRVTSMTGAGIFTALFCAYITLTTTGTTKSKGIVVKYLFSGVVLSAAIASSILSSLFAAPNVSKLDDFLFRYFQPNISTGTLGLSDQTTLQSVSALHNMNTNKVAIRVFSKASPEYLRAHVRDTLKGRVWECNSPLKPLRPVTPPDNLKQITGDNQFFQLRSCDKEIGEPFQVWSASYQSNLLFTTLDTADVAASPTLLEVDGHRHCAVEGLPRSQPYLLFTGNTGIDAPDALLRQQCLQIPESLTDAAKQVCVNVTTGQKTSVEKIRAVTHYFRSNYTYQYGIRIPSQQDPLSYFLTERPAAHCEYFASGAVIMLRLAGVPARYVTGFVVTEKNTSGGYWIARNKDAHAWAEAWDEQRGWVVVEATPPDGMPHSKPTSAFAAFRDMLKFKISTILAMIREQGVNALGELLRQLLLILFMTWPGRILSGILLLGAAIYGLGKHRPHWRKQKLSLEEEGFLRLLSRVDKYAARYGFVRRRNETLQQFANRIHTEGQEKERCDVLSDWYATCATLRCDGTSTEDTISILENLFEKLPQQTS